MSFAGRVVLAAALADVPSAGDAVADDDDSILELHG
jgi:hypothetical protein